MAFQQQQQERTPYAPRGQDLKSNQQIESRRHHHYQLFLHEPHVFPEKDDDDDDDDDVSPMQKRNGSEEDQEEEEDGDVEEEGGKNEERDQRDVTEVEDEPQQILDTRELQLRCNQLQDDVEVLAAHLETQTQEREKARSAMSILQNQLQQANMEMARDLQSLRIENVALRRHNAVLQQQRDEFEQKALFVTETHDELLLALNKQQQIEEQLQNSNAYLTRECAQARKALETAQNHCRRLEEELAATQTQLMRLQDERKALQVALAATYVSKNDKEAEKIRLQEEMIDSLRADFLQMEFEYKTLAVDREALAEKVSKLLRKNAGSCGGMDSGAYDVIPLGNATTANTKPLSGKQQKQLQKAQQLTSNNNVQPKRNIRPVRSNYESENGGFSGVMELPNFVGDRQESFVSASLSLPGSTTSSGSSSTSLTRSDTNIGNGRRRSSVTALVSKTVSSAKKKFFVPGSNKLVLPQ
uniref:Uncharacterized protein n=1 Tax=Globisporangium ultimum (strain ATCC 200006 / CBS 805.95 / DAOM BR144) TaxID=431595 RepID=K3X8F4_GLOUD